MRLVTAVVQLGKLAASYAFAFHGRGGEVVTWGAPEYGGGDSSQGQQQPGATAARGNSSQRQQQPGAAEDRYIQATRQAFATIAESGAVVVWGDPQEGGDRAAEERSAYPIRDAFVAILESGAVVTWGPLACGGDSSHVQEQLSVSGCFCCQVQEQLRSV